MGRNLTYFVLTVIFLAFAYLGYNYFLAPRPAPSPLKTFSTNVPEDSSPVPTLSPQVTFPPSATPTPEFQSFTSDIDNFSIAFSRSRQLYQDKESTGNRYTLYSPLGNIAIHVGQKWSWIYPHRVFTSDFLVAGQSTFIYDLSSQTITDFQFNGKSYTIQCVHRGSSDIKAECLRLLKSFQLTASGSGS